MTAVNEDAGHVLSNIVIEIESADAAGAPARCCWFGASLVGSCRDRFARTAEGWRFAERRGRLHFGP